MEPGTWADQNLTFWQHLAGPATWANVPGTREEPLAPDTWIWAPALQLSIEATLDDLNRMVEAGWQHIANVDLSHEGEKVVAINGRTLNSLLLLSGQLGHVRHVHIAGTDSKSRQIWASQIDLERIARAPVILAFTISDELAAQAPTSPTGTQTLSIVEVLPPPHFGTVAMVAAEQEGVKGWRRYTIDQLEENAQELQGLLWEALGALAGGELGWVPITGDFDTVAKGNYGRAKGNLRGLILSTHDNAQREHLRDSLARLDAEHERYQAIRNARHAVGRETWLEMWEALREVAHRLAVEYWTLYQTQRRAARRTLPMIPDVFGDGKTLVPIPSMMPIQAPLLAYSHAQSGAGWASDYEGRPTFTHNTEHHKTAIQVRPDDDTVILDDVKIQSLWQQVREFSDLDGDVFLAMLAQWTAGTRDEDGCVWIMGSTILDYRGVQPIMKREGNAQDPRRAGHRQEDLMDVARCVGRQSTQWIILRSVIEDDGDADKPPVKGRGKGKGRGRRLYTHESRLTQVTEVIRQHELVMPDDDDTSPDASAPRRLSFPVAWRYRFGTWLDPFLKEPNRQVAWLCQQALKYDPYHETWEKRLARYFLFHLRINAAGGGAAIKRNVGTLLRDLNLPTDERHPERTRQRFERAMARLAHDAQIDGWAYAPENPALPARKWLETWLGWSVYVTAAALTQMKHQLIAEHAQARRDRAATLNDLKAAKAKDAGASEDAEKGTQDG